VILIDFQYFSFFFQINVHFRAVFLHVFSFFTNCFFVYDHEQMTGAVAWSK